MEIVLRNYRPQDRDDFLSLWNDVIEAGNSFPGEVPLTPDELEEMLAEQSSVTCAFRGEELVGLSILHPNNIGRCGHIANASYAVKGGLRGQGIGRRLVLRSLADAKACGFTGLQFNAVVATNEAALALYQSLGFQTVGTVPGGFRLKDGQYVDTVILFKAVK